MNSQEIYQNVCRICLDENVVLNWNNTLFECYGVTYKDCYYKYTHLEYLDEDPFSPMLCENCLNVLQNIHTLVEKALESYKFFMGTINNSISEENEVKYTPTEFETVVVEELYTKHKEEKCVDEKPFESSNSQVKDPILEKEKIPVYYKVEIEADEEKPMDNQLVFEDVSAEEEKSPILLNESENQLISEFINTKVKSRKSKKPKCKNKNEDKTKLDNSEKLSSTGKGNDETKEIITNIKESDSQVMFKDKKNPKEAEKLYMCSFCSKVFPKLHAAKLHEKTHIENRERNETCHVCGLKFFNKGNLREHLRIHNADREKKHKCDFCDKAFYNKSSLNVHRRVHLGQMIPCTLCSKQFLRQVDLDLHMNTHSAITLNGEKKKRSRYFVRCKYCNKSMLSTSYRSHTAVHLNQPLMKCLICDKEYFRRESCTEHLKTIHHKKKVNIMNIFLCTKRKDYHICFWNKRQILYLMMNSIQM